MVHRHQASPSLPRGTPNRHTRSSMNRENMQPSSAGHSSPDGRRKRTQNWDSSPQQKRRKKHSEGEPLPTNSTLPSNGNNDAVHTEMPQSSRQQGESSGTPGPAQRTRTEPETQPIPETQQDSSMPNSHTGISLGLITGDEPPIKPRAYSGVLEYVPLVKLPEDWAKPDLIRVLTVHPGDPDDAIICSIKIRILPRQDAQGAQIEHWPGIPDNRRFLADYIALSYAWGEQTAEMDKAILVCYKDRHLALPVTDNLHQALKSLRHRNKVIHIWADAVCMDQENDKEKSQQLPLMSRIYSEASHVCVWLGDADVNTNLAFDLMQKLRVWQNFKTVVEKDTTVSEWIAFTALMNRQWFKRRWVVQEIVLAGIAKLRCGPKEIDWMHFAQAVAFFEAMRERVKLKFRQSPEFDHHPDMFGEVREFSASRLVKVTADIVSRRDDGRVVQKKESLESLISKLTPFEAGQQKDIIYAVLSLAKDVTATTANVVIGDEVKMSDLPETMRTRTDSHALLRALNRIKRNMEVNKFPVSYAKPFDEVCDDLYKFTTLHSLSLDLICRPWCPPGKDKLPSWVRSLKQRPFTVKDGNVVRINGDPLVGMPDQSPYQASGILRGDWRFERDTGPSRTQLLCAKGFQLDILDDVEDCARGGTLPQTWLKYSKPERNQVTIAGRNPYQDPSITVSERFWRTMIAGKGPNGQNPSLSYSLVCQELFDSEFDINLEKERNLTTNEVLLGFIDRVLSVIWGRRLAETVKHRRLALLPEASRPGDIISILYGCSVPVVLRKTKDKTADEKSIWELIGECYVYEMMAGEALAVRRKALDQAERDDDEEERTFFRNRVEFNIR